MTGKEEMKQEAADTKGSKKRDDIAWLHYNIDVERRTTISI